MTDYSVSFLRMRGFVKRRWCLLLFFPLPLWCGSTIALFQPSSPSVGPYPNNALTIQTATQKTGLQVNLPFPAGCTLLSTAAQCINTQLLNQLDGAMGGRVCLTLYVPA